LGKTRIGFTLETERGTPESERERLLEQGAPEDLIEFGMIPEFVGRLPVIAPLMPLTQEAMVQILTEPKNALIRQYQHLFSVEDAKLSFTEGALRAIAEKAQKRDTGARGLRAVMEEIMVDLMYELPDWEDKGAEFVVDEAAVRNRGRRLADLRVKRKE